MIRKLLLIEKTKLLNYSSFWIIMSLFSVLIVLSFMVAGSLGTLDVNGNSMNLPQLSIYEFPILWHYLTYIAGFLHYLPALLIILVVTNDIQYGLWRQNVADGLDRKELLWSKVLVITVISIFATILLVVLGLVYGLSHTHDVDLKLVIESAEFLVGYFVQLFAYMVIALLFAVFIKSPAQAIVYLLVYGIIVERLISLLLPEVFSFYLPMAAFSGIISNPYMNLMGMEVINTPFTNILFVSLAWIVVILVGLYAYIRSQDI
ncbi:MAG: hypothetical protein WD267_13300 [Balneolales bacterium]